MRTSRVRAAATAVSLLILTAAAAIAGGLRVGDPAPAFVLPDATGRDVSLGALRGRPLVINVFASWCPPCRQELPRIVAAARGARGRVTFLGVDEQEPRTMALSFVHQMHLPYAVVFDQGQFAASYGAQSLPETAFLDASGRLVAVVHGPISARDLARDLSLATTTATTTATTKKPGRT